MGRGYRGNSLFLKRGFHYKEIFAGRSLKAGERGFMGSRGCILLFLTFRNLPGSGIVMSERIKQALPLVFIGILFVFLFFREEAAYRQKVDNIRFYKESISIYPHESSFRVVAVYYYRNLSPEEVVLKAMAPFPVDDNHSYPTEISLDEGKNLPVVFEKRAKSIEFYMVFQPNEEKTLTLDYNQAVKRREGRYILTTTSYWHKPLEEGYYFLYPEKGMKLKSSCYPMSLIGNADGDFYYFGRRDFMPPKDWEFKW